MLLVSLIAPNMNEKVTESFKRCFGCWRSPLGSVSGHDGGKTFDFKGIRAGCLPLLIRLEPCFSLPATADILIARAKAIVVFTLSYAMPEAHC